MPQSSVAPAIMCAQLHEGPSENHSAELEQLTEPGESAVNFYLKALSFRVVCYTALDNSTSTIKNQPFKPITFLFYYNDLVFICEEWGGQRG